MRQRIPVLLHHPKRVHQRRDSHSRYARVNKCREYTRRLYRPEEKTEEVVLKEWCCVYWEGVLSKAINTGSTVFYHDCCLSFSRKGFTKKSGHPAEMSVSVHRLPELKKCKGHEDFFVWIEEKLSLRRTLGLPLFFPTINCCHTNLKIQRQADELHTPSFLVKRYKEMEDEVGGY